MTIRSLLCFTVVTAVIFVGLGWPSRANSIFCMLATLLPLTACFVAFVESDSSAERLAKGGYCFGGLAFIALADGLVDAAASKLFMMLHGPVIGVGSPGGVQFQEMASFTRIVTLAMSVLFSLLAYWLLCIYGRMKKLD